MNTGTAHVAFVIAACAVLVVLGCDAAPRADPRVPAVSFQSNATQPGYGVVDVAPVDRALLSRLPKSRENDAAWHDVFVVRAGDSTGLPMLGSYTVVHDTLRFTPRFAPVPGTTYYASYRGDPSRTGTYRGAADFMASGSWRISAPSGPSTTVVEAVYPSSDSVPMNLLRMYMHFSAPMSIGEADRHMRLVDDRGQTVDNAFLVAAGNQELWDGEHRRLTIFFDPGRIKRDLAPHEQLGLPLQTGRTYRFVIDSAWRDARGRPLARGFTKELRVGPIDRTLLRTATWRVSAPAANTRATLTIAFPEPIDRPQLLRMLVVKRQSGEGVEGGAVVAAGEMTWSFTPGEAWRAGEYYVEVVTELEDLAGNNLKRLFDVMPRDSASRGVDALSVRIGFTVR